MSAEGSAARLLRGLRSSRAKVVVTLAVGIALALLVVLNYRHTEQERSAYGYLARTNHWIASQLELELIRFLSTLDAYVFAVPGATREQLRLRSDILWSRVPLFLTGREAAAARAVEGAEATVRRLEADLEHLDPLIRSLEPGDRAARDRIVERLSTYQDPLNDITVAVSIGEKRAALVQELKALSRVDLLHTMGVLAAAFSLVVFLLIEIRRSEQRAEGERRARLAAEVASVAKSRFLANMSHELRTPLNAIIGFSEIMSSERFGPVGKSVYREYAEDIQTSGRHLLTILNDVLDLARVEAGAFPLEKEAFDPGDVVRQCLRILQVEADRKQVALVDSSSDALPPISGDPRLFRQICLNLVGNGIKFTPPGGRIVVGCRNDAGQTILTVDDDGPGIPPDQLDKIAEPFHQGDAGLNRRHEGCGLGLALSRAFAELHGGRLQIRSEVGKGTCVAVAFPSALLVDRPAEAA